MTTREIPRQDTSVEPEPGTIMEPGATDRSWHWWAPRILAVLIASIVVAGIVYAISNRAAATYQSSAVVRVSVQATGGISDPAVIAANDLASQFAQLASEAPVVDAAEAHLGESSAKLGSDVTAGTIAAQNLIRVSVTGPTPAIAQARTTAVAEAFVAYANNLDAKQAAHYANAIISKLGPLNAEIAAARKLLLSANPETVREATVLLSSLITQQQTVLSSVAQSSAAAQPSLQLVAPGGTATKVSPKPSLYAAVGFFAALLLLGRLLYVIGVRRGAAGEPPT